MHACIQPAHMHGHTGRIGPHLGWPSRGARTHVLSLPERRAVCAAAQRPDRRAFLCCKEVHDSPSVLDRISMLRVEPPERVQSCKAACKQLLPWVSAGATRPSSLLCTTPGQQHRHGRREQGTLCCAACPFPWKGPQETRPWTCARWCQACSSTRGRCSSGAASLSVSWWVLCGEGEVGSSGSGMCVC